MTAYCLEVSLLKVLQRWLTTGLQKILAKAIALYRLQNLQVHKNHHLYTKQAFVSCLIAGRHYPIYSARLSPFRLHLKHNIFLFFFTVSLQSAILLYRHIISTRVAFLIAAMLTKQKCCAQVCKLMQQPVLVLEFVFTGGTTLKQKSGVVRKLAIFNCNFIGLFEEFFCYPIVFRR